MYRVAPASNPSCAASNGDRQGEEKTETIKPTPSGAASSLGARREEPASHRAVPTIRIPTTTPTSLPCEPNTFPTEKGKTAAPGSGDGGRQHH